jgi:DNA processing protein
MGTPTSLPDAAYAAALASITALGPRRLSRLLDALTPSEAWASVVTGRDDDPQRQWQSRAVEIDVAATWAAHEERAIRVLTFGGDGYPGALADDPEAPAVLFALGDPQVVDRFPRVAIVGTRSATRYGLGVAAQLGADLAAAGVIVVSGLALGIDGAAHEGAVASWEAAPAAVAPPVGVVAGSLDVAYPGAHARLWQRVAGAGAIYSESPVGTVVPRWRFPQRNRIIAAMAEVVVVVECHPQGGALHTVRAALQRGVTVGAVPGSVRSPASAGTNDLLGDGALVVRDAGDVLIALGRARAGSVPVRPRPRPPSRRAQPPGPADPSQSPLPIGIDPDVPGGQKPDLPAGAGAAGDAEQAILGAMEWESCSVEQVLRRTGLSLADASAALEHLRRSGRVRGDGGWWEQC